MLICLKKKTINGDMPKLQIFDQRTQKVEYLCQINI